MRYPELLLAIRRSGLRQYQVAQRAGVREGRLSAILRHKPATTAEKKALAEALKAPEITLFEGLTDAGLPPAKERA
jgi:transcriptional regulator with XRE-family HTH domain